MGEKIRPENLGGQDSDEEKYSAFLEVAKREEKRKEELESRIAERLKFLEQEESRLELLKENPKSSAKEIWELEEVISSLNDEVIQLSKEKQHLEADILQLRSDDEWAKRMLEEFEPRSEH